MGFKDANWAYKLKLPMSQKVVLVAIAHADDDRTHQTYVSQKTLAGMVGMSVATVNSAVRVLDEAGIVTRRRRSGSGGYRTTDLITVNVTYVTETNLGETNVGETHVGLTDDLLQTDVPPTSTSLIAMINQNDQPDNQPDISGASKLCKLLADLVESNGSKRPTIGKTWTDAARLLLEKDNRPLDEAITLIEWCQQDSFWKGNILSMPTFREKYDQLRLKRESAVEKISGGGRSTVAIGREVDAILKARAAGRQSKTARAESVIEMGRRMEQALPAYPIEAGQEWMLR